MFKSLFFLSTSLPGLANARLVPQAARYCQNSKEGRSREASHFRLILGFWCVNSRFHSPLGDLQPLSREHFSHVLQAQPAHVLQAQPMLFKLAYYFVEVFIMFLVVTANYSHTVMQVVSAGAIVQYLPFSG